MSLYLVSLLDHVLIGEGHDHELNADIHAAFGLPFDMEYPTESHTTPVPNRSRVPCYTSSVEAVMALVVGTLPGHGYAFDARPGRMALGWVDDVPDGDPRIPSIAKTAARAMLAAAVRARIALEDRE